MDSLTHPSKYQRHRSKRNSLCQWQGAVPQCLGGHRDSAVMQRNEPLLSDSRKNIQENLILTSRA